MDIEIELLIRIQIDLSNQQFLKGSRNLVTTLIFFHLYPLKYLKGMNEKWLIGMSKYELQIVISVPVMVKKLVFYLCLL